MNPAVVLLALIILVILNGAVWFIVQAKWDRSRVALRQAERALALEEDFRHNLTVELRPYNVLDSALTGKILDMLHDHNIKRRDL